MRFDYQPALANTRILKTSRQRKLFLLASFGMVGCLIIISSLVHTITNYNGQIITLYPKIGSSSNLKALTEVVIKPESIEPVNKPSPNKIEPIVPAPSWHTIKIQAGDTLISLLQKLSISSIQLRDLNNFIKANLTKAVANIKTGQSVGVLLDERNNLKTIKLVIAKNKTVFIDQVGPRNYKIHQEEKPIIKKLNFATNKIIGSFFSAAQEAGLDDTLIMEMADIFGWDIDFVMDIRPNDKFRLLYEDKYVDNEKIGTGHILVAEFINQKQIYQAVRYTDAQGRTGYYSPQGYSMNKTFLRNPVKFTRIGSKFSTNRHHPILHRFRAHKGVDYVAPSGTPVKAAGDGKVVLIGRKGGYGNVVELMHGNKYSTLYAHLSNFAQKLTRDSFVKQGQVIGYVGRTGLATGDHLHYEFRVDGVHRDPLTVQLPKSMPLPSKYRAKFLSHAQQMLSLLDENDMSIFTKK
jgi:murein DD-endopeptidase MepM/ murein hydrolase activator NlpD